MTKLICDKCGKELTKDERFGLHLFSPDDSINEFNDLCKDCANKVLAFIDTVVEEEA